MSKASLTTLLLILLPVNPVLFAAKAALPGDYPNLIWVIQEEFKYVGHTGTSDHLFPHP